MKNNPLVPNQGVPSPNIRPQPMTQNDSVDTAKTMKFFARMFTQFLARHRPLSTNAKPAFMKNTSIAVISTHVVSMPIRVSLIALRNADENAGSAATSAAASATGASCAVASSNPINMGIAISAAMTHFFQNHIAILLNGLPRAQCAIGDGPFSSGYANRRAVPRQLDG